MPVCWEKPARDANGALSDSVVCQGGHLVSYEAMKSAGLATASRYALTMGKTHVLQTSEANWLTAGEVSSVDCFVVTRQPSYFQARNYPLLGWPQPETSCAGGVVTPGTEGHVLRLTISILSSAEAQREPGARRAFEVLGYRDPPDPPASPTQAAPGP
ncbi:MAG: hypothetical protein JWM82_3649 [Myxococcales bacterium]|nr:hypothetical protein [Myxococcales bacterium]